MIVLDNGVLSVKIAKRGAEMQSVITDGEERLWNGDPAFWPSRAPLLFPICGGLPDDKFTFEGKEYTLMKHGFVRTMDFELEKANEISAVFLLKDNEETLKQYPWHFELRVKYFLRGKCIDVSYEVKNTSGKTMYMSIGSHEAYACPEGIENYDIIFEKKETLSACDLDGNLIADSRTPVLKDSDTLPLYTRYFAVDALVFKDMLSRSVTLRNRITGKSTTVDFDGCDYFLLWTKPGAGYICLEPWTGIPPVVGAGHEITEKEGISAIKPAESFNVTHKIHF